MGLGNASSDFTTNQGGLFTTAAAFIEQGTPEWDAFEPLNKAFDALAPNIITEVRGVNVADKIGAARRLTPRSSRVMSYMAGTHTWRQRANVYVNALNSRAQTEREVGPA